MRGEKDDCPYCDFWTVSGFLMVHISRMHSEKLKVMEVRTKAENKRKRLARRVNEKVQEFQR